MIYDFTIPSNVDMSNYSWFKNGLKVLSGRVQHNDTFDRPTSTGDDDGWSLLSRASVNYTAVISGFRSLILDADDSGSSSVKLNITPNSNLLFDINVTQVDANSVFNITVDSSIGVSSPVELYRLSGSFDQNNVTGLYVDQSVNLSSYVNRTVTFGLSGTGGVASTVKVSVDNIRFNETPLLDGNNSGGYSWFDKYDNLSFLITAYDGTD